MYEKCHDWVARFNDNYSAAKDFGLGKTQFLGFISSKELCYDLFIS